MTKFDLKLSNNVKIKIIQGLSSKIVKDTRLLKSMCVFYSLKFLYSGGIILNISKRYPEIADRLNISETNLRSKVKYLIEKGLIVRKNNNLTFISFNNVKKIFKIKTFKSVKIEYQSPKELETLIKCIAINENLIKQEYQLQKKILKEELKRFGKIEAKTIKKKILKQLKANIGFLTEKYKKRKPVYSLNRENFKKEINPVSTLSRFGVAKLFSKKSKSTGSRFLKKLKVKGILLEDEKRIELIHRKFNFKIFKSLELDSSYFIYRNNLYQRLPNKISLINFFA